MLKSYASVYDLMVPPTCGLFVNFSLLEDIHLSPDELQPNESYLLVEFTVTIMLSSKLRLCGLLIESLHFLRRWWITSSTCSKEKLMSRWIMFFSEFNSNYLLTSIMWKTVLSVTKTVVFVLDKLHCSAAFPDALWKLSLFHFVSENITGKSSYLNRIIFIRRLK